MCVYFCKSISHKTKAPASILFTIHTFSFFFLLFLFFPIFPFFFCFFKISNYRITYHRTSLTKCNLFKSLISATFLTHHKRNFPVTLQARKDIIILMSLKLRNKTRWSINMLNRQIHKSTNYIEHCLHRQLQVFIIQSSSYREETSVRAHARAGLISLYL